MNGDIIYNKGGVEISQTLARFGGTSYPIAGVGSVFVTSSYSTGGLIVGILMAFIGVATGKPAGFVFAVIGALLAVASVMRTTNSLMLRTSSGDQLAFTGTLEQVSEIKAAIERAVQMRG